MGPQGLLVLIKSLHRLIWPWGYLVVAAVLLSYGWRPNRQAADWALLIPVAMLPYIFVRYVANIPSRQTYLASALFLPLLAAGILSLKPKTLRAGLVAAFIVYNVVYMWTVKDAQMEARALPTTALEADWDRHRLVLGLPEGSRDLETEKTVLLEAGFDELHGVSWTKGCYMGQELTARTRYRGLVKRRLVPVTIEGPVPEPGTPVLRDGREVGTMRSGIGQTGLAVLRLEAMQGALTSGEATLTPRIPTWMQTH